MKVISMLPFPTRTACLPYLCAMTRVSPAGSARRKTSDRGSVMTLLYREASPAHPLRRGSAQLLLMIYLLSC